MKMNNKIQAGSLLLLAQLMTGINIVGSKYLLSSLPILFLLLIRFGLGTLCLLPICWFSNLKESPVEQLKGLARRDFYFILAQAVCAGVLFNLLMLWGLSKTQANVAGIITSALPAVILILSWLILREALTLKKAGCIALATLGLIIISNSKSQGMTFHSSVTGDLIIFLALVPEAMYYVLSKLYKSKASATVIAVLINFINTLLMLPIALFFMPLTLPALTDLQILVILAVGLSSALFYVFWALGSVKVDAAMGSLSTALMPICTVVIAAICLDEMINLSQGLGMLLVIGSILFYAL